MSGKNIDIPSHVNALWRTICLQTPEGLQIHIDRSQIEGAMNALAEEFRAEHLRTVDEYNKKAEADLRHIREIEETASRLRQQVNKPRACDIDEINRLRAELEHIKKEPAIAERTQWMNEAREILGDRQQQGQHYVTALLNEVHRLQSIEIAFNDHAKHHARAHAVLNGCGHIAKNTLESALDEIESLRKSWAKDIKRVIEACPVEYNVTFTGDAALYVKANFAACEEKIQQLTERAEDAEQKYADACTQCNELIAHEKQLLESGDKLEHERQEIENRYITLRTVAELCANELESLHKFHYHECKGDCPADTFAKAVRGCNLPELVEEASRKSKTNLQLAFDIVQKERIRQTSSEGYTPQHDDAHSKGELAGAAAVYALEACGFKDPHVLNVHRHGMIYPARVWPWADHYWKPSSDPIRNLAKAGALILAEIERIIRKSKQA